MREREDVVVAVIAAAPGASLTSRVRLQKVVYLLDRLGFESGFGFEYHHYGPYSRVFDNAIADARALKLVDERIEHRLRDGASYSVFAVNAGAQPGEEAYGNLGRKRAQGYIARFADTNVTVLELAATIDFLWRYEKIEDWRTEVGKRKRAKIGGGRLEKAVELLESLGLKPPEPGAAKAA
jgi:uncharacterized protein